jgi:transcription initiation factor TFIIB
MKKESPHNPYSSQAQNEQEKSYFDHDGGGDSHGGGDGNGDGVGDGNNIADNVDESIWSLFETGFTLDEEDINENRSHDTDTPKNDYSERDPRFEKDGNKKENPKPPRGSTFCHIGESVTENEVYKENESALSEADNQDVQSNQSGSSTHSPTINCNFCGHDDLKIEDGNFVCDKCYTVVSRFLDNAPEWRYFGYNDSRTVNPTRCCPPSIGVRENMALGTSVYFSTNASSRASKFQAIKTHPTVNASLVPRSNDHQSNTCRMMQKYHLWNSLSHREKNLYRIFDMLTINAMNNGIPSCILDEAKSLYKKVSLEKIARGENRQALIACSIYMACKTNNVPRSIKEISSIFGVRPPAMTKACKMFQNTMKTNVVFSKPCDFIPRFCSKLGLGLDTQYLVQHVVHLVEKHAIVSESSPPSLVATVIFMCCQERNLRDVSKADIASVCQISQVTISKCFKRLASFKQRIMPPDVNGWISNTIQSEASTFTF